MKNEGSTLVVSYDTQQFFTHTKHRQKLPLFSHGFYGMRTEIHSGLSPFLPDSQLIKQDSEWVMSSQVKYAQTHTHTHTHLLPSCSLLLMPITLPNIVPAKSNLVAFAFSDCSLFSRTNRLPFREMMARSEVGSRTCCTASSCFVNTMRPSKKGGLISWTRTLTRFYPWLNNIACCTDPTPHISHSLHSHHQNQYLLLFFEPRHCLTFDWLPTYPCLCYTVPVVLITS
ncbi:hypothetical protein BDF14DRAFT_551509 [Spinellus fusiger]|nr:hypothetical protein BDF14DRAFT_551509 [Spinellus fusiger]